MDGDLDARLSGWRFGGAKGAIASRSWTARMAAVVRQSDGRGHRYAGVRALPSRAVVHIGDGIRVGGGPMPAHDVDQSLGPDAAVAEISDQLRVVAGAPCTRWVGLTGGRDSRLILAHLLHAGLQDRFRFVTWNISAADVAIATSLARRYDFDHTVVAVGEPQEWVSELRDLQWRTDGMAAAADIGKMIAADGIFVSGGAGELLSTYYGKDRPIRSQLDVRRMFDERVARSSHLTLARPAIIERYAAELQRILDGYAVVAPERVPQMVYLDHRLHRWQGTARESGPRADVVPLLSPNAVAGALHTPHEVRRGYGWHGELWRCTVPELGRLPFADADARQPSSGDWPPVGDVAEVLLDDPQNPVFELIDRTRLEQMLASGDNPGRAIRKQLINAGLAIWARDVPSRA